MVAQLENKFLTGTISGMRPRLCKILCQCLVLWLFAIDGLAMADEVQRRHISVGIKLFPAVLAAYEGFEHSPPEKLMLFILYQQDQAYANSLANTLRDQAILQNIPQEIRVVSYQQLYAYTRSPPHALFLAESDPEGLEKALRFSKEYAVLSFSPFRGDVERGILAGMQITDRVLPFINMQSLMALPYSLKPFFLRIAVRHEP